MAGDPAPFVKWAGGKKQLLDLLIKYAPRQFATYFEPFLGGGALFFRLHSMGRIRKAVLSDANRDLMNCYFAIRENMDALLTELELLQCHAGEKDFFYEVARPKFNRLHLKTGMEGEPSKAALLIYLNKTCYNGLYRVNSKGEFNVPWGRYDCPRIYDEQNIKGVGGVLRDPRIQICCCDASAALSKAKSGDFIYLDPPYQPLNVTSSFTSYTPQSFSEADQRVLADAFKDLDRKGSLLLLSNSKSPLVEELYGKFMDGGQSVEVLAARQISCKGSGRGRIGEYVISNYGLSQTKYEANG
jgi:DNA adenine methylase